MTEGGSTTLYRYDGGDCYQELNAANGSLKVEFVRGSGLGGGIGSILYSDRPGESTPVEYFAYNAVGHTVALTDGDGDVTKTDLYEAFGNIDSSYGSSDNNRLANTKERSAALGLDNHGFRYYDPEIGRYLTRDPIGYGDGLNVYLYVGNNPVNRVDPEGLTDNFLINALYRWIGRQLNDLGRTTTSPTVGAIASFGQTMANAAASHGDPVLGAQGFVADYQHEGGLYAVNRVANPAYIAMEGAYEATTGRGMGTENCGEELDGFERAGATGKAVAGTAGTVAVGVAGGLAARAGGVPGTLQPPKPPPLPASVTPEGAVVAPEGGAPAATKTEGVVFRSGGHTPDTFTPRPGVDLEGLSTFDTLEAAVKPGGKAQIIDMAKVEQPLVGVPDAPPVGHVSIRSGAAVTQTVLQETADWAATRGTGVVHPLTEKLMRARVGEARRPK